MKRAYRALQAGILLAVMAVPLSAGVNFGVAAAGKAKVKELDKSVRAIGKTVKTILGKFRFVTGAASTTAGSAPKGGKAIAAAGAPSAGNWSISPDKVRFHVNEIRFLTPEGVQINAGVSGCSVTYDRSLGSGKTALDCSFQIASGTYSGLTLGLDRMFEVFIEDDANHIYTSPASATSLTSTRPVNGADYVTFPVRAGANGDVVANTVFERPLSIGPNTVPVIQMLMDGVQTVLMVVDSSGTLTFNTNCLTCGNESTGASSPPITVYPFVSDAAQEFVYGSTQTSTVNQFGAEHQIVRVFYETPGGQPTIVGADSGPWWGLGGTCDGIGTSYHDAAFNTGAAYVGAYLGRDAGGTISGVTRNTRSNVGTYGDYASIFSFKELSVIGSTTTFNYKCDSNPPAPASGSDYSSGAPSFTPDGSVNLTLFMK